MGNASAVALTQREREREREKGRVGRIGGKIQSSRGRNKAICKSASGARTPPLNLTLFAFAA